MTKLYRSEKELPRFAVLAQSMFSKGQRPWKDPGLSQKLETQPGVTWGGGWEEGSMLKVLILFEFEDWRANPKQSCTKLDTASCNSCAGGQRWGRYGWLVGQPMSRLRDCVSRE